MANIDLVIGRRYHLKWAKANGMCWELVSFDESKNIAVMETPMTGKRLTTQLDQLYNTNTHDFNIHKKFRSHKERKSE